MGNKSMMELSTELDEKFDGLVKNCLLSGKIDQGLYARYDVKRGLRDSNGKGVLTGLTEISDVVSMKEESGDIRTPIDGKLYFQGYDVEKIINGNREKRFLFEESTYLLLFGELPNEEEPEKLCGDTGKPAGIIRAVRPGCDHESTAGKSDECPAEMYHPFVFL